MRPAAFNLLLALLLLCGAALVRGQCTIAPPAISADLLAQLCSTTQSPTTAVSPSCTIYRICASPPAGAPAIFPSLCNTTRLAASFCLDDAAVAGGVAECTRWVRRCCEEACCCQKKDKEGHQQLPMFEPSSPALAHRSFRAQSSTLLSASSGCKQSLGLLTSILSTSAISTVGG